ncbi:hypothetical protein FHX74_003475 [Friedmanniella endophytica]|uniref:DUF5709 domain-containing protein n=1 Tax=Microlunatus kandeliicorticis TaxID=1759536 RepID=A0A7W3IV82_9ACTN|nr:DUF5709 domain-containing protein [Microlunatus kandeliicorticis]MBA8795834.1 hypothetical protein [Microlunatus kandeliicorticis]
MSEYTEGIPDEIDQLDQDQMQPYNSLEDRGVDDFLDEGYSPPEKPSALIRQGEHETLDERLAEEEPEEQVDPEAAPRTDLNTADLSSVNLTAEDLAAEDLDDGEVGRERAGRLVDPNGGIGADVDSELIGDEVGIDGAAASAEEAAVRIVDEP